MGQVIEFESLARSTTTAKWPPDHQRGKVIPFMSQRKALYKPVCTVYEELDSESPRWPDRDEAFYRAALEYAQAANTGRRAPVEELFGHHGEELFGVLILDLFSDGSQIGS